MDDTVVDTSPEPVVDVFVFVDILESVVSFGQLVGMFLSERGQTITWVGGLVGDVEPLGQTHQSSSSTLNIVEIRYPNV